MARKSRDNYNIDLLRLCYKQPEGLFEFIAETKPNTKIPRDGYYLFVIGDEDDEELPRTIMCKVVTDDGVEVGEMVFNCANSKYGRLCFFRFNNAGLYNNYISHKGSMIYCIDYITDDLGLEFISVTELHIANDSNVNRIVKLMRYKRDFANFDMIVNRKRIDGNREKIQGYKEVWQSSRKRKINPTIYIEQRKDDAPKLCCYNKSIEIAEQSGKEYISSWNEFGNQTIYRTELRLRWEYIKDYFDGKGIKGYGVFNAILQPQTLKAIFEHFSSRLIYFRNKYTDEVIALHNIA